MLRQFRDFISRGNGIDLAAAVIIAAAFTAMVQSLVKDIVKPLIGAVPGRKTAGRNPRPVQAEVRLRVY